MICAHVLRCTHMTNSVKDTAVNRATVTFHTSPEVKARLDRLATMTDRSKSYLTNEAVERYLAEEEAFVVDVEEGLAQANRGELIGHAEVVKYFDSLTKTTSLPFPKIK